MLAARNSGRGYWTEDENAATLGPEARSVHEGTLVAHTLRAEGFDASEDGTGMGTPIVTTAVCAKWAKGTSGPSGDEVANIVAFDPIQVTSWANRSSPQPGDPCHTLPGVAAAPLLVAFKAGQSEAAGATFVTPYAPTLQGANNGSTQVPSISTAIPRRLTPGECEALQSFPRGWTEWGLREDGTRWDMADGPRYRMMGNAVTVNVVEWIARRVVMLDLMGVAPREEKPE